MGRLKGFAADRIRIDAVDLGSRFAGQKQGKTLAKAKRSAPTKAKERVAQKRKPLSPKRGKAPRAKSRNLKLRRPRKKVPAKRDPDRKPLRRRASSANLLPLVSASWHQKRCN